MSLATAVCASFFLSLLKAIHSLNSSSISHTIGVQFDAQCNSVLHPKGNASIMNKNEFGSLVKSYRQQRGWTQEELSERWGYSRGYVAQIEAGKRKLDSAEQVVRLADILDIPQEKLEAIGRG